jgi:hypothetical protein
VVHYVNARKTAEYLNVRSESEGCSSLVSELVGNTSIIGAMSAILLKGKRTNGLVGFYFDENVRRDSRISL